jgi:hypothetical protein
MKPLLRKRQMGWSLLESVVVVSIVGLMAGGFWKTLAFVEGKQRGEQALDTLQRAEDALYGLALRDHRLPMPEDAVPSTLGPNHWEGWLPTQVLGTEPPRSIRYVVDRSLAAEPAAIYRADPLALLGNSLAARTTFNGFDLCMQVVQREQASFAGGPAPRLALGVQQVEAADRTSGRATPFRFQNTNASAAAGGGHTRATGYLEFVDRLGCVQAFAGLSTEVKAAVLASDLRALADLDVSLRSLAVRDAEDSLLNHEWRVVNAMARLAVSSWNLVATKLTGATTPLGAFKVAANVVGFTLEAARWASLIDYSLERAERARNKLEEARERLVNARTLVDRRSTALERHLQRVNTLQTNGLLP